MVIGFSGKVGSGKSTISAGIANQLNWKYASFGNYVRKIATIKNIQKTRKNLQQLGETLINESAVEFCKSVLKESSWSRNDSLIIDGIRHKEILEIIRDLVKPDSLKLIFLNLADQNVRSSRLSDRNEGDLGQIDTHSTEIQITNNTLFEVADLIVDAEQNTENQKDQILAWLRRIE